MTARGNRLRRSTVQPVLPRWPSSVPTPQTSTISSECSPAVNVYDGTKPHIRSSQPVTRPRGRLSQAMVRSVRILAAGLAYPLRGREERRPFLLKVLRQRIAISKQSGASNSRGRPVHSEVLRTLYFPRRHLMRRASAGCVFYRHYSCRLPSRIILHPRLK
jgi:hypothetical protein